MKLRERSLAEGLGCQASLIFWRRIPEVGGSMSRLLIKIVRHCIQSSGVAVIAKLPVQACDQSSRSL